MDWKARDGMRCLLKTMTSLARFQAGETTRVLERKCQNAGAIVFLDEGHPIYLSGPGNRHDKRPISLLKITMMWG